MADDVLQAEAEVELLLERLIFEEERLLADRLFDDDADLVVDDRFGEVVEGAHLGRFDGAFDGAVTGDDDDDNVRGEALEVAEELGRFDAGHVNVGQEELEGRAFELAQGLLGVVSGAGVVAFAGEELGEGLKDDAVFVENEQAGFVHVAVGNHRLI